MKTRALLQDIAFALRVQLFPVQSLRRITSHANHSKDRVLSSVPREYSLSRMMKRKLSSTPSYTWENHAVKDDQQKDINKQDLKSDRRSEMSQLQRLAFPRNSNLFQRVDILLSTPLGGLHPLDMKYTCMHILKDCCKEKTWAGMEKSRLIIQRLINEKKRKNSDILKTNGDHSMERITIIPRYAFHIVMYGFVKLSSKHKKAIEQCKDLLQMMWDEHAYDSQQQDLFFERMEGNIEAFQNISSSCRPTVHDYNTLLNAHAYGTKWDPNNILKEAESIILATMISLSQTYPDLSPDVTSFNQLIRCYANSGREDAGHSAQSILEKMQEFKIQPDLKSYTGVIAAFAQSNNIQSSAHAEKILLELVEKVQTKSWKNQILQPTSSNIKEGDEEVYAHQDSWIEPDQIMFTTCIQGWVNAAKNYSNNPKARFEAAQQAEKILNLMYELAAQWEKDALDFGQEQLSTTTTTSLSTKSTKNSSPHTNPFLPDLISWNTVLAGWAKSDSKEAAPHAQQLLDELIHLAQNDVLDDSGLSLRPDRNSFHIVMDAWARYSKYETESASKVENLRNQMYDLYHSGRFKDNIKPNAMTYIIAMKAWARYQSSNKPSDTEQGIPFKVQKCRDILDSMISKFDAGEEDLKPNVVAYTTILNAIVHSPRMATPDSIISMAFEVYNDILQDPNDYGLKPDDIVFGTMLQVVKNHLDKTDDARRSHIEQVFDDACRAGFVSISVLRELASACPSPDLLERLIGRRKLDTNDSLKYIKKEWKKNIR